MVFFLQLCRVKRFITVRLMKKFLVFLIIATVVSIALSGCSKRYKTIPCPHFGCVVSINN